MFSTAFMTESQKAYLKEVDSSFIKNSERVASNIFNSFGHLKMLGLLFITLKLTGTIDWSWWFVVLPYILSIVVSAISSWAIILSFALMAKVNVLVKRSGTDEKKDRRVPINE